MSPVIARLAALPEREAQPIIDELAKASIGVVTFPATNLYLLGRSADVLYPRGLTRVRDLQRTGVAVACASDNIQDAFVPTGSGDILEIASWTMLAGHYDAANFPDILSMITSSTALMTKAHELGRGVGATAHLLTTGAVGLKDLIANGPLKRTVLFRGKVGTGTLPNRSHNT